jgi:hypothetical protein
MRTFMVTTWTAFLHRNDGRAGVAQIAGRHRLVHAVPQARQRIVELADRAQAAEPDQARLVSRQQTRSRNGRSPDPG